MIKKVTVFFDGGARMADGIAAGAAVVYDGEEEISAEAVFLKNKTVNEA
jgi:ribonuclease HI